MDVMASIEAVPWVCPGQSEQPVDIFLCDGFKHLAACGRHRNSSR